MYHIQGGLVKLWFKTKSPHDFCFFGLFASVARKIILGSVKNSNFIIYSTNSDPIIPSISKLREENERVLNKTHKHFMFI